MAFQPRRLFLFFNQFIMEYNLDQRIFSTSALREEASLRLSQLPEQITAAEKIYFEPNTNVFINDAPEVDSLTFLGRLRGPLGIKGPTGENRNVAILESAYLSDMLAMILAASEINLSRRIIVPMPGCGETAAISLVKSLSDNYGITLNISQTSELGSLPAIVVDDVIKTGGTILRELPPSLLEDESTIYATWAMSALTNPDYLYDGRYSPLRQLTAKGQRIFAGVVYAGSGLASPGMGLPLNSISTLVGNTNKSNTVLASLAKRYFGTAIYRAASI